MEKSVSEKLLLNLVNEKYEVFKSYFPSLLSALCENEQSPKYQAVKNLNNAATALASILAKKDRPIWLNNALNFTRGYLNQHTTPEIVVSGANWRLNQEAWKIYDAVMTHNWDFSNINTDEYDFDEIYKKYRNNSNISALFDSLIQILTKMVNSGEIDSLKAITALNELIATLSQNKDGSYFSTMVSMNFVKSFLKNYAWEQVGSIPGIKSLKKAFENTAKEMDIELSEFHEGIREEMKKKYKITVQTALSYKKDEALMLEDKSIK